MQTFAKIYLNSVYEKALDEINRTYKVRRLDISGFFLYEAIHTIYGSFNHFIHIHYVYTSHFCTTGGFKGVTRLF